MRVHAGTEAGMLSACVQQVSLDLPAILLSQSDDMRAVYMCMSAFLKVPAISAWQSNQLFAEPRH